MSQKHTVLKPDENGLLTLCGDSGCCPTLQRNDANTFTLTDDDGNKVTLTNEQVILLQTADLSDILTIS